MAKAAPKRGRPRTHYLSVQEIMAYLNVSRATLYRMCDQGMPFFYVGSYRRFDKKEVELWVRERSARIRRGELHGVAWLEENEGQYA